MPVSSYAHYKVCNVVDFPRKKMELGFTISSQLSDGQVKCHNDGKVRDPQTALVWPFVTAFVKRRNTGELLDLLQDRLHSNSDRPALASGPYPGTGPQDWHLLRTGSGRVNR